MKKTSIIDILHLLLGANILLWLNAGTYQLLGAAIPMAVKLLLVAMWFAISFIKSGKFFSTFAVSGYLLALFYLLCIFSNLLGIDGYFSQYGMNLIYILIEVGILCYYYNNGTRNEVKFLLIIFALDIFVVGVRTFIMLQGTPEIVRILSTSAEHKVSFLGKNIPKGIATYGFCYQLVLLQPALAYFLNKKKVNFMIKVLIYGLIMMFLFQAQITLALVMYPILLALSFSFGQSTRSSQGPIKLLAAVASIILIVLLPSILRELIQSSEVHLSARLEELYNLIIAQDTSGSDIQSRMALYRKSLDAFLDNPLWGAFGGKVYGSHSTLFDMLGAYGILGLIGYFGLFRPFNWVKRDLSSDKAARSVLRITLAGAIVISLINVIVGSEMMLTLLVIVPLLVQYLTNRKELGVETGSNQLDS